MPLKWLCVSIYIYTHYIPLCKLSVGWQPFDVHVRKKQKRSTEGSLFFAMYVHVLFDLFFFFF